MPTCPPADTGRTQRRPGRGAPGGSGSRALPRPEASSRRRARPPWSGPQAVPPQPIVRPHPVRRARLRVPAANPTIGGPRRRATSSPPPRAAQARGPRQVRVVAKQRKAAGGRGLANRTRDDKARAALLERPAGGDERAAFGGRLDHDGGIRKAADKPVAAREGSPGRARVRRELADERTACVDDDVGQLTMRVRVESAVASTEHRDRSASFGDDPGVCRPIDPEREPRNDA